MNRTKIILVILLFICILVAFNRNKKESTVIFLSYTHNFEGDSITNKLDGLKWALSYLGADLKDSSFYRNCVPQTNKTIRVCFDSIGFSGKALEVIRELTGSMKSTQEYKSKKSIDIGEFIALTIGTSKHYYAITNVFPDYDAFKTHYFSGNEKQFAVVSSSVTPHHRRLLLHTDKDALRTAFVAEEGSGSLDSNTFKPEVFEVFDLMPNGQLRFAVYDKEGRLIDGSPSSSGQAGKPAKCMWCHELYIQPLFKKTPDIKGYISEKEFTNLVSSQMLVIETYRKEIKSGIDFTQKEEHTQMELLYISYMEPSLHKLSQEWNMEETKLKELMKNHTAHRYPEFPFLGELYDRRDLKKNSPFKTLMPQSVRETGGKEPLLIKLRKNTGI